MFLSAALAEIIETATTRVFAWLRVVSVSCATAGSLTTRIFAWSRVVSVSCVAGGSLTTRMFAWLRVVSVSCVAAGAVLLIAIANVSAQVAGELRGRVVDAATAQPVVHAQVELSGRTEIVHTGADGAFVVRGLEPRVYTVTFRAVGYRARGVEVAVTNARVSTMDMQLTPSGATLADVVVRGARDSAAKNSIVFTRVAIEQSGRRDLGELLQTTPGIVVTQAGGAGQAARVSIRGSSAGQVLVLVDGVALNSAISGDADVSRVSLESVERVTVQTGMQSARYGPRAMAGVIEIETRKPTREISTVLRTGSFGEHDAALSVGGTHAMNVLSTGASLVADYRTIAGDFHYALPALRGGGTASRINSDATSTQLTGGASLGGLFGSAALRATWQHTDRGLAGTIIQPSSTGRQGFSRWGTGANAQGTRQRIDWTAAADVTTETGTYIDRMPPFGAAFDDTVRATGITASTSATLATGAAITSMGAEVRTLDITSTMLSESAPHWQRLLGAWGNTRYLTPIARSRFQFDGEVSARIDQNSLDNANAFSPRVAARISRGTIATSVSLGSGYAPPTLSDQFFHEGVQAKANPSLKPERTRHDLEARVTVRDFSAGAITIGGEAAAYHSDVDGMILWFPDFRFIWSPNNYNVQRRGFELSGKTTWPVAHIELQGSVNRSDVTYAGGVIGGQVAYRPRNSASISASFAPKFARIDVTHRYVGARRTVPGSSLNMLDPYWMTDAKVSSSLVQHAWIFTTSFAVENVFNRAAAMLVDYPFPSRALSLSLRVRRAPSHSS